MFGAYVALLFPMFRSALHLLFILLALFAFVELLIHTTYFKATLHAAAEFTGGGDYFQLAASSCRDSGAQAWSAIKEALELLLSRLDYRVAMVAGIIFLSSIAEAGFGFGGGLLAIPILSFVIGLQASVSVFLIFQTLKGALLVFGFKYIAWGRIWLVVLFLPLGAWLGFLSLERLDQDVIRAGLGAYLIGYVVTQYMPRLSIKWSKPSGPLVQIATGILTGYVQGLMGSGGPLLATYLKACDVQPNMFRFSVIFMLFFANALRIALAVKYETVGYGVCSTVLICLPGYIIALLIGYRLPKVLTDIQFSRIVNIIILLAAVSLLLKNLL